MTWKRHNRFFRRDNEKDIGKEQVTAFYDDGGG
jgi:hypothetical protein